MAVGWGRGLAAGTWVAGLALWCLPLMPVPVFSPPRELQAMEALQNGQATLEGSIEGQCAGAASHAVIEKILSEEPRWQGKGGHRRQAPPPGASSPRSCPKDRLTTTPAGRVYPLTPLTSSQTAPGALLGSFPRHALLCSHHPRCTPDFSGAFARAHLGVYVGACVLEPPMGALITL